METFDLTTGKPIDPKLEVPDQSFQIDEETKLSERLFQEYEAARSPWATQAIEDVDFRNGAQWSKEDIKTLKEMNQAPLVVNVIHPAIEQMKALLTARNPRFSATGREASDKRTASAMADLLEWVWYVSDGNMHLKTAIDDYATTGLGYLMTYYDPHGDFGKGEVMVRQLNPFDVYIDPNSTDRFARDAAHILVAEVLTKEQIQLLFPGIGKALASAKEFAGTNHPSSNRYGAEGQASNQRPNDATHRKHLVIDRYSNVKIVDFRLNEPISGWEFVFAQEQYMQWVKQTSVARTVQGATSYILGEAEIADARGFMKQYGSVTHVQQDETGGQQIVPGDAESDPFGIPGSTTILQEVENETLVKSGIVLVSEIVRTKIKRVLSAGGLKIFDGILPVTSYPIRPCPNRHLRNPYPLSDVRMVRGLQEYINKTRSIEIAHGSAATGPKLLVNKGSVDKQTVTKQWTSIGPAVIEVDYELGKPEQMYPPPLPNEFYKAEVDAKQDVDRILGVYVMGQGDVGGAPDSVRGTIILDEFGQRRIKSKQDDIEAFLNSFAQVVVEMIQAYYTEPKVIRLLRPNNIEHQQQINTPVYDDVTGDIRGRVNDVTVGKYDVVVVSGSTLPSNRWARLDTYMNLYEKGVIDREEVLKQTEVVDTEGVLARMSEIANLQAQLQQAEAQIKQLSGDLQTAQRESVQDRKRVEVEKFKSSLKGHEAKMGAAAEVFAQTLKNEEQLNALRVKAKSPVAGK